MNDRLGPILAALALGATTGAIVKRELPAAPAPPLPGAVSRPPVVGPTPISPEPTGALFREVGGPTGLDTALPAPEGWAPGPDWTGAKWPTPRWGITCTDDNGDGRVDLRLADGTGRLHHYANQGGWRFRSVPGPTEEAPTPGFPGADGEVRDLVRGDLDGDGDLELVAGLARGRDAVLDGDAPAGPGEALPVSAWGTSGLAIADIDGDGRLDIVATDLDSDLFLRPRDELGQVIPSLLHRRVVAATIPWKREGHRFGNVVLRSTPDGWQDWSAEAGIEWLLPRGIAAADFDLDGDIDLFMPSGMGWPWDHAPDAYFRNRGDGRFDEVAEASGLLPAPAARFFGPVMRATSRAAVDRGVADRRQTIASTAAAACDLDDDGDQDLVVLRWAARPTLYENLATAPPSSRLVLRIGGAAAGARVEIVAGGRRQVRVVPGREGRIAPDPRLFFGLPPLSPVESVRVTWPGGSVLEVDPSSVPPGGVVRRIARY